MIKLFGRKRKSREINSTVSSAQPADNVSPYWRTDDIRIKIDKAAVKHFERYRFAVEKLQELNCVEICDVACGSGYGSWILSGYGNRVMGIDIEEDVINYALNVFKNERVSFIAGNVAEIELPDSSFDAIVSFETIEHIDEPEKAVAECRRIIRPGGYFVFSIPINHPDTVYHKKIYSLEDAKSLIESFEWVKIDYYCQEIDTPYIRESCDSITTLIGICQKK